MEVKFSIDGDLEAKLLAFYTAAATDGESIDKFCGRVVLGQVLGNEVSAAVSKRATEYKAALERENKQLLHGANQTVKDWATNGE